MIFVSILTEDATLLASKGLRPSKPYRWTTAGHVRIKFHKCSWNYESYFELSDIIVICLMKMVIFFKHLHDCKKNISCFEFLLEDAFFKTLIVYNALSIKCEAATG